MSGDPLGRRAAAVGPRRGEVIAVERPERLHRHVEGAAADGAEPPRLDKQADGGTHVRSTGEVGSFTVTKTESKGKGNKRIRIAVGD